MTVREKLSEIKNDVLSIGIEFSEVDFVEYTTEEFDLIDNEFLNREIERVVEFKDDPMYIEIICKEKE